MKGKELLGLIGMFIMLSIPIAMALDADTPYTVTMIWAVPTDTTFSVVICSTATNIVFNASSITETGIEPDCQVASSSIAILNITNDGNTNINMTGFLTTAAPAFVTDLNVSTKNDWSDAQSFNNSPVVLNGTLAAGDSVPLYMKSSILNADVGDTDRLFQINTTVSS